jgi:hypothetical protein
MAPLLRFGGQALQTIGALGLATGTAMVASGGTTAVVAALAPLALPAAAIAVGGAAAVWLVKRLSSRS